MNTLYQEENIANLDFSDPRLLIQSDLILDSYQAIFNRPLLVDCPADATSIERARLLFLAPQAVLSHDREWRDGRFINIYNYANRASCLLFERTFDEFVQIPSMQSAASIQQTQQARNHLLARCVLFGAQKYAGERKTATGKSINISDAVLFNLVDEFGVYRGQAAVIEACSRQM